MPETAVSEPVVEEGSKDVKIVEKSVEPVEKKIEAIEEVKADSSEEKLNGHNSENGDAKENGSAENGKTEEEKTEETVTTTGDTNKMETEEGKPKAESTEISEEDRKRIEEEYNALLTTGKAAFIKREFFDAADAFGKACEKARELYGELGTECADLYFRCGCALLECGKNENTVLGENMKEKEGEDEDDDEEGESDDAEEADKGAEEEEKEEVEEAMEAEESTTGKEEAAMDVVEEATEAVEDGPGPSSGEPSAPKGDAPADTTTDELEDDDSLKAAWEMFELAKVIYSKENNGVKLSETYMKLGEVGVESGHRQGIEDMKDALKVRMQCYPENHRIIPETHFHIGLAFAVFQQFDEAIEHFNLSKALLEARVVVLEKEDSADAKDEVVEIKKLIPELDEKIADMIESKEEQAKSKAEEEAEAAKGEAVEMEKEEETKEKDKGGVKDISHLVKRKRKSEEVPAESPATKQPCVEPATAAPAEPTETAESAPESTTDA